MHGDRQYRKVQLLSLAVSTFGLVVLAVGIFVGAMCVIASFSHPKRDPFALFTAGVFTIGGSALTTAFCYGCAELLLMLRDTAIASLKAAELLKHTPTHSEDA